MASLNEFTQVLGWKNAAHLLRRTTFGPTAGQIETFSTLTPSQALTTLLSNEPLPAPPVDTATGSSWVNPPTQNKAGASNSEQDVLFGYFKAWHCDVMLKSGVSIKERMTWFYHTHMPAAWTKISSSEALYYQNCLFRYYALDNFKDLFKKICIDNAMLVYIDGYTNHKNSPNENFAREMFELYSIGKGPQLSEGNYTNYTEDDVKAATKVLTGWLFDDTFTHIDADTNLPIGKLNSVNSSGTDVAIAHDETTKKFSSLFGGREIAPAQIVNNYPTNASAIMELDDMIEMIFEKQETARFIVRKLYRSFVYHFISEEVENDIIRPLAETFYNNNYQILPVLERLFKSEHFYDADTAPTSDNNIGALIKTPVDLTIGLLRFFETPTPNRASQTASFYENFAYIVNMLKEQGIDLYEPYDVAGFDAYFQIPGYGRNWILNLELARRYQVGELLMKRISESADLTFKIDALDWVENSGFITDPSDSTEVVTVLVDHLLAVEPNEDRFNYFLNTIFLDTLTQSTWQYEWTTYKSGGNDSVVRERIETLVSSLIQTPEFQLY